MNDEIFAKKHEISFIDQTLYGSSKRIPLTDQIALSHNPNHFHHFYRAVRQTLGYYRSTKDAVDSNLAFNWGV